MSLKDTVHILTDKLKLMKTGFENEKWNLGPTGHI